MTNPREVDLAIVGGTLVAPSGTRRVGVAVDGGRVVAVAADDLLPPARRWSTPRDCTCCPGCRSRGPPGLLCAPEG